MLTKAQKREYLKQKGVRCPFCKSDQIKTRPLEVEDGGIVCEVACDNCARVWRDYYTLTSIGDVD